MRGQGKLGDGERQDAGAPSPSAVEPALDPGQLSVLRRLGRQWRRAAGDCEVWRRALPVDPSLGSYPDASEIQPAGLGRFVAWGDHLPLEVLVSPYRAIVAPMINYIESLHRERSDLTITVIVPEIVVRRWWHRLLHNQIAPRLRRALRPLPKIVITTVPFHVSS